jgi:hypothetical protein
MAGKQKLEFVRRLRPERVKVKGIVEFVKIGRKWHFRAAKGAVKILTNTPPADYDTHS